MMIFTLLTIIISTILCAFLITYYSIPSIIKVSHQKGLCDEPNEPRKIHLDSLPNLGGIAIFGGIMISSTFFVDFAKIPTFGYALAGLMILFFTGVKDDIIPLTPSKKFMAQIVVALILAIKCDIRLTHLYGFLWLDTIPYWVSVVITVFTILVIVNAYNLIDGINGLSGGLGVISSLTFGIFFFVMGYNDWGIITMATCGALLGFLMWNFGKKSSIIMGDTGSLTVGLLLAIFALQFIEFNRISGSLFRITFAPVYAVAILILPLLDTFRLFILRVSKGKSPFSGDRNHFHHYLVDSGLTHPQASCIMYGINIFFILFMFLFQSFSPIYTLPILLVLSGITTFAFWQYKNQYFLKKIGNIQNAIQNNSMQNNPIQNNITTQHNPTHKIAQKNTTETLNINKLEIEKMREII